VTVPEIAEVSEPEEDAEVSTQRVLIRVLLRLGDLRG
jgi:hypothetical protein